MTEKSRGKDESARRRQDCAGGGSVEETKQDRANDDPGGAPQLPVSQPRYVRRGDSIEYGSAVCVCGCIIPPEAKTCPGCGRARIVNDGQPGLSRQASSVVPVPVASRGTASPPGSPQAGQFASASSGADAGSQAGAGPSPSVAAMLRAPRTKLPVDALRLGFGQRIAAQLLDGMILLIPAGACLVLLRGFSAGPIADPLRTGAFAFSGGADYATAGLCALMILYALIEAITGASPGKRILGIVVRSYDATRPGRQVWLFRSLLKNAALVLALVSSVAQSTEGMAAALVLGAAVLFGGFGMLGASRQALHDTLCRTAVFYAKDIL